MMGSFGEERRAGCVLFIVWMEVLREGDAAGGGMAI